VQKPVIGLTLGYLENQKSALRILPAFAAALPQHLREREMRLEKIRNHSENQ
jgi:hypothetical protein